MPTKTPFTSSPDDNLQQVDAHSHLISRSLSIRAYANTEPLNGKIAQLQKGLILTTDGTETIGEGTGFGLPVLIYSRETYFSGSSKLYASMRHGCCIILKDFTMDRIARNSFRNVTLENGAARTLIAHLSDLYQKHGRFRLLTLKKLTVAMSIAKTFPAAASMGNVRVTYILDKSRVQVRADFKNIESRGLQKIFMLNEQGSRFFSEYSDSLGTKLSGNRIGAWDVVESEWACLTTRGNKTGFRLWRVDGSVLRRGREFLDDSLDWVGLDYQVSRRNRFFEYAIDLLEDDLI